MNKVLYLQYQLEIPIIHVSFSNSLPTVLSEVAAHTDITIKILEAREVKSTSRILIGNKPKVQAKEFPIINIATK